MALVALDPLDPADPDLVAGSTGAAAPAPGGQDDALATLTALLTSRRISKVDRLGAVLARPVFNQRLGSSGGGG
jgi:hypothetical protein